MANKYSTLAAFKMMLTLDGSGTPSTDEDAYIEAVLERASRLIDVYTHRDAGAFAVSSSDTRYFRGSGKDEIKIDGFVDIPTVAVAEDGVVDDANSTGGNYTNYPSSDWWLVPDNAVSEGIPYRGIQLDLNGAKSHFLNFPRSVKVTATFGYAEGTTEGGDTDGSKITPLPEIEEACLIQTMKVYQRTRQGFEDVGAIAAIGQLRHVKALDPLVRTILDDGGFRKVII